MFGCRMVFIKKWNNPSQTPTYRSWRAMIYRCYNKSCKDYYNYGGRGIEVCKSWLESYDSFFMDMGEKPKNLTLDRINSDGNYEYVNCRWANAKTQANNKRTNINIEYNGKIKNLSQWSKELGINSHTLAYRVRIGMDLDKVFENKKLKPGDYKHLKNIKRKNSVFIDFNDEKLTIAQWSAKTGLSANTIRFRIFECGWDTEKALTTSTERYWNHGTNTGYSTYSCRCILCTEFNRVKSQKARYKQKLKQHG